MTNQHEAISILLTGRCYLYPLLQAVFGREPDAALLDAVTGEYTRDVLDLFSVEEGGALAGHLALFATLRHEGEVDLAGLLDRLCDEYTRLLIGPGKVPAPPWESVYLSKDRLLFQESTLKVRRAYQAYGLLPAEYPRVADDHLAMELGFMAHLARISEERFDADDTQGFVQVLTDQKAFLDDHLLKWIGTFAEKMQESKTNLFYPQMAQLAERAITFDRAILEELLAETEKQEER